MEGDRRLVKHLSLRSAEEPTSAEPLVGCPSHPALMISEHLLEQGLRGGRGQGDMGITSDLFYLVF